MRLEVSVNIQYQYALFSIYVSLHLMELQHVEFENIYYFNIFLLLVYLVNFLLFLF
jgi:hypothetical protein